MCGELVVCRPSSHREYIWSKREVFMQTCLYVGVCFQKLVDILHCDLRHLKLIVVSIIHAGDIQ